MDAKASPLGRLRSAIKIVAIDLQCRRLLPDTAVQFLFRAFRLRSE